VLQGEEKSKLERIFLAPRARGTKRAIYEYMWAQARGKGGKTFSWSAISLFAEAFPFFPSSLAVALFLKFAAKLEIHLSYTITQKVSVI
jgi:hypothetical protein